MIFFPQNFISHHIHLLTLHFNSFHEHIMLLIHHLYFVWTEYRTSVISSYKYIYCKYRKTIWTDLSNNNSSRPVLQIPQCIRQTSLNAPLRTGMCPSPLWTVHRGTLPRHHWGHRWLSIRITPSARRRLAHRNNDDGNQQLCKHKHRWSYWGSQRKAQTSPGIPKHGTNGNLKHWITTNFKTSLIKSQFMHLIMNFVILLLNFQDFILHYQLWKVLPRNQQIKDVRCATVWCCVTIIFVYYEKRAKPSMFFKPFIPHL